MNARTGYGWQGRRGIAPRRQREGGSFSSTFLTFSVLLLVMALGFVFGRVVIARAYVKATGAMTKAPDTTLPGGNTTTSPGTIANAGATTEDNPDLDSGFSDASDTAAPTDTTAATTEQHRDENSSESSPEEDTNTSDVRYAIQVGVFSTQETARRVETELTEAGYPARIERGRSGSRTVYKVLTGHYPSEQKANDALSELQRKGYSESFIVAEQ